MRRGNRDPQTSVHHSGELRVSQNHVAVSNFFFRVGKYLILVKLTSVLYIADFYLCYNSKSKFWKSDYLATSTFTLKQ